MTKVSRVKVVALLIVLMSFPLGHTQTKSALADPVRYEFDVASIKPELSSGPLSSWKFQFESDTFEARDASARKLITYAFSIDNDQLVGAPAWLGRQKFAVDAKIDLEVLRCLDMLTEAQQTEAHRQMVLQLLVSRFGLFFHMDKRDLPGYALVVGKRGTKLKQANSVTLRTHDVKALQNSPDDAPLLRFTNDRVLARNIPLQSLIDILTQELGRSVVDETGLKGNYSFELRWSSDSSGALAAFTHGGIRAQSSIPQADPAPALTTALSEQLGLVLVSKRLTTNTVVIDRITTPSGD